jgi:hypothetical protein
MELVPGSELIPTCSTLRNRMTALSIKDLRIKADPFDNLCGSSIFSDI